MANIDTIIAFSQGKQRFGFMKNDYFLVAGVMYYKGMEWPVAVWTQDPISDEDVALINADRRGNDHTIPQYVLEELNRLHVTTRIGSLKDVREIIDG